MCLRPHFHFAATVYFRPLSSLTGTLAGNTWFQSPLPSVSVLYWTISCTQTQPRGKPSGPTHRIRSKYLSMIFKAWRDLGPMHFSAFSSWDALVVQCPSHTWHLPSSLVCQVQLCSCDFIHLGSDPLPLCLVETNSSSKVQPHGTESVQTPLSNLPTPGITGQPKESKKEILKNKIHLPNHSHLTVSTTFICWPWVWWFHWSKFSTGFCYKTQSQSFVFQFGSLQTNESLKVFEK